ncbi:hypothetical protein [Psychroserpens sp. SPM9]|uniref:hypothetical protein n=1 Tax=Psychroserpens sp. SPM9 TaxID=2975598 RepID=UPI0021A4F317|nr:hypothetical protein [Psychroserpens sp. SPM9]MDG5493033.1 hypothetical protein [Psychroserpens sp. SPM9]
MKFLLLLSLLSILSLEAQNSSDKNLNDNIEIIKDSISYSESDFDKMVKYYSNHEEFSNIIHSKAKEGDTIAKEYLTVFKMSYSEAIDSLGGNKIHELIDGHYKIKSLLAEMEMQLQKMDEALKLKDSTFKTYNFKSKNKSSDSLKHKN